MQEPVKSADEVIKEIDDMIEGNETDEEKDGDVTPSGTEVAAGASSASSGAPPQPPLPSYSRSSRIVSEALAGRRLEELSANELTQVGVQFENSDVTKPPNVDQACKMKCFIG